MVYTKYTFFHGYFFKFRKKTGNWCFSKLKGKKTCNWCTYNWCICTHYTHEKKCIWCTPSICCEIRKIGQRQIGDKIISVFKQVTMFLRKPLSPSCNRHMLIDSGLSLSNREIMHCEMSNLFEKYFLMFAIYISFTTLFFHSLDWSSTLTLEMRSYFFL